MRKITAVAGTASVLAAVGWPAVLTICLIAAMIVLAACWILSDPERSKRLVQLISALRRR